MGKKSDLTGKRLGKLIVIAEAGRNVHGQLTWHCRCDCGAEVIKRIADAKRQGRCGSCGWAFTGRATAERNFKHGGAAGKREPLYHCWTGMRDRCSNPNHIAYARYGGRGIAVCLEWETYEGFRGWALPAGYRPGLTLDRVDSNLGYQPDNCEWVTKSENSRRVGNDYWRSMTVGA